MTNSFKILGAALSLFGILFATENKAEASNFSLGIGLNYSRGNQFYSPVYGAPIYGYGAGFNGMYGVSQCAGALQGALIPGMGMGGGFGGMPMMGGVPPMAPMMPQMPMLPPPPPRIPPHMLGGGIGGGFGGPMMGGGCGGGMPIMGSPIMSPCMGGGGFGGMPMPMPVSSCQAMAMSPCAAGMLQQPMYPVAGGPMINAGASVAMTAARDGIYNIGGQAVIDLRERESGYGDVVWAAALGLGMQTTNVYPIAFPRNDPIFQPFPYATGLRDYGFYPRPTTSH